MRESKYAEHPDINRYIRARVFMEGLRKHEKFLTTNEIRELKEQALRGDVESASKKVQDILIGRYCNGI